MQPETKATSMLDTVVPETYRPGPRKKAFWLGLAIIALVALAAVAWVVWGLQAREREFEANLQKRLELMGGSQVQLVTALTEVAQEQANRVINSDLFRLYASEVHLIEEDVSRIVAGSLPGEPQLDEELAQLSAQLPMMQNLLAEFTMISGYLSGRVVNRNGTVYLATDATTTPLRHDQKQLVKQVLQSNRTMFGPMKNLASGLVLEAFLPIFPPQASGLGNQPVAVLLLTKVVGKRMDDMRGNNLLMDKGERIRLIQKVEDGYQEVVSWMPDKLKDVTAPLNFDQKGQLSFAVRPSLTGEATVYSLGVPVPDLNWWVVVEADYSVSREVLRDQQRALVSIAALLILFFGVTFGAVWAALIGQQDRKVAKHFEQLAQQIEKQRQLLDQINNNIADYIVMKDLQGRYQYVNPAFAEAVGRSPEELIGLDNEAVFGYDTARRLEHSDQQVLTSEEAVTFNETVFLQSNAHHLQISKAPLKSAHGKVTGLVSVIRDVTEIVEVQKRQEQATHKTVEALVRAIELIDPYLAGHSRLMGSLAVEVAKALNASDLDVATVETAANLSQVGKLFVDRNLLFKSDPLTADEKKEMEQHVEHAGKVLRDIDFGLPVFEAIYQMNECLDGQGYPKGISGEEISPAAQILGVVNSFCAMVEPRAYRGARAVDESLDIISKTEGAYASEIVEALKEVVQSSVGEKLLARHTSPE